MSDSYTETQHISWLQRIKDAIGGVMLGFVLVIGACAALFWNEGRAVQTARSLAEGGRIVVSVTADRIDPANEGKLVHVSGPVKTGAPLVDPDFGVSARGVRLVRSVEMYQWREHRRTETRKNLGGSEETVTVYDYRREWLSQREDSSRFHRPFGHENPEMRYHGRDIVSTDATLGAFSPGESVLRLIQARDRVSLEPSLATQLRDRLRGPVQVADEYIFLGSDFARPRIGDHRISFHVARPEAISVVARQAGTGFEPYQTVAGDRILMADAGIVPAQDMFRAAERQNTIMTWLFRVLGFVFIYAGFALILRPLVVVGDLVPLIGSIVGAGVGLASLVLTLAIGPVIIGVAWLYYRPLVGIAVLVAGALATLGVKTLASRRAGGRETMQPAQ